MPVSPGERVKIDPRDGRRLARLHEAGLLVAIEVPSLEPEGSSRPAGATDGATGPTDRSRFRPNSIRENRCAEGRTVPGGTTGACS